MDSLVKIATSKIAKDLNPEKIILFGSRAKGISELASDVDLLIVYGGPLSKREVKLRVRHLLRGRKFSLDLFVLTPDEYRRQQNVVSTVGRAAATEGLVCYG